MLCDCCTSDIGDNLQYIFVIDHPIQNGYYCYSCYKNILLVYIDEYTRQNN